VVATPEYTLPGAACGQTLYAAADNVGALGPMGPIVGPVIGSVVGQVGPGGTTHSSSAMNQLGTVYATKRRRRNGKR